MTLDYFRAAFYLTYYLSLQKVVLDNIFFFGDLQTLSAADLRNPEISALIAAKMREFHSLDMPGPKNVLLWDRMRYGVWIYIIKIQKLKNM
jgi:hypothetical protein